METDVQTLQRWIGESRSIVFFGGAEVSTAWRELARKSQYLKKNSSPRLNTMDEATAIRDPRSLPRALHRSTSIPWV